MQPDTQEQIVFKNLAQSGEGAILANYLGKLQNHLADKVIDGHPTLEDVLALKHTRAFVRELQTRLTTHGIINANQDRLD